MPETRGHSENSARRYETQDATTHGMVWSGIGLALLIVAGLGASWLSFKYFVTAQKLGPPASPFENTRELPPAPRLQVRPSETLREYQAEENSKLNSYGWVDKDAGVVHIPIERAMQLSLERGFPVRTDPGATARERGLNIPSHKSRRIPPVAAQPPGR